MPIVSRPHDKFPCNSLHFYSSVPSCNFNITHRSVCMGKYLCMGELIPDIVTSRGTIQRGIYSYLAACCLKAVYKFFLAMVKTGKSCKYKVFVNCPCRVFPAD